MENQNKYFTPCAEDIRLGYECEIDQSKINPNFSWTTYVVGEGYENITIARAINETKFGGIRVSYLNKEQIEAEGWIITYREIKPHPYKVDWINAKKENFKLWINLALTNVMHLGIDKDDTIVYRGECKDINTFRQICKLLNIK